jgi:hypothetical protein
MPPPNVAWASRYIDMKGRHTHLCCWPRDEERLRGLIVFCLIYYDLTDLLIKQPTPRLTALPTDSNFIGTIGFAKETGTWRGWASRRKFLPTNRSP